MHLEKISSHRLFNGWQQQFTHVSRCLGCTMRFAIYLPPLSESQPVPVLYWLSGLTCNDENFMHKAGAQRIAARFGMALVAPDTSPRGEHIPDDPAWDLGVGAGFYVNATQAPWCQHYQMYDYVVAELPELVEQQFPVSNRRCIAGHSMGGHGALVIALRNPDRYSSVSAFSPICHPVNAPWGQKAFSHYLGDDRQLWQAHDASELIKTTTAFIPILVDQGSDDPYLKAQLQPEALRKTAFAAQYPLTLRIREGYDHSYYFVATFIEDHVTFHRNYVL